jgi:3-hydroxyacyl-[acyl-carrier-protein] dehydratase
MESSKGFTPLELVDIQKCLPHRHPFLLIDRVLELVPFESIKAIKCVSASDPILQGHFPDFPVMPGVMIVEGMAQAAGVLGHKSLATGFKQCLLTEIVNSRFRRQVVPGDVLVYDIKVKKSRPPFFWFDAVATVDGDLAAKVQLSALMK